MKRFFKDIETNQLLYRVMPYLLMELMGKYFRLEVEGVENIPRRGPGLITPNHSGYAGFDAVMLMHEVQKATKRIPRMLTHPFWFWTATTAIPATKAGFLEATIDNGLRQLQKNNLVVLFPEGEYGNFKATSKRYHLQEFKRGFVRMALQQQCPIIPTLVLGAEETHINLGQLKLDKYLPGAILPLPLNIIPLPSKWKIIFLDPIVLPYNADAVDDRELVLELSQQIRETMQKRLSMEVAQRGSAFF
jgi:1-acyl-sn-glycerol-3-phosphate acyltransferase